jgi:hypothetical protein
MSKGSHYLAKIYLPRFTEQRIAKIKLSFHIIMYNDKLAKHKNVLHIDMCSEYLVFWFYIVMYMGYVANTDERSGLSFTVYNVQYICILHAILHYSFTNLV